MGHSSRCKDLEIRPPTGCGSMGKKDVFYE